MEIWNPFDQILRSKLLDGTLRLYATGTEIIPGVTEPIPNIPDSLDDEILKTLREIRDILRDKE